MNTVNFAHGKRNLKVDLSKTQSEHWTDVPGDGLLINNKGKIIQQVSFRHC